MVYIEGWKPDTKLGYKLVMEGVGSKIFFEFFKEFTDSVDVAGKLYPKMTAKNNYIISRYFSAFKELGYLERSERRKFYKKRTKRGVKGKGYKIIKSSRLCECFRGNLNPFFRYTEDNEIVFSEFEEKLLALIFDLKYVRDSVYEYGKIYGSVFFGIQNILLDMISIRLQTIKNNFIILKFFDVTPASVVHLMQNLEVIKKLYRIDPENLSDKDIGILTRFVDKQVAFIDDWSKKKESDIVVGIDYSYKGEFKTDHLSTYKDKIKFILFSLHLPQSVCYNLLNFAPSELSKVMKVMFEDKFREETEFDFRFQRKVERQLRESMKEHDMRKFNFLQS